MTRKTTVKVALAVVSVSLLWAVTQLRVPVDREALKQAEIAVRDAQQEGNPAATMRAYRRWLEFYPNEPAVQAGIYHAMALLCEQTGDVDQAKLWGDVAHRLDPTPETAANAGGPVKRGGADKLAAALAAIAQTAQTVQTFRAATKPVTGAVGPVPMPTTFPAQPVGTPGMPPMPVTQPMPGFPLQPQSATVQPQPIPIGVGANPIPQPIAVDAFGNPLPAPPMPIPQPQPMPVQQYPQPQPQPMPVQQYPQPQPQSMPVQQYPQPQSQPMPAQQYPQPQSQSMPVQQYPQPQSQSMPAQQYPQPQSQQYPQPQSQPPTQYPQRQAQSMPSQYPQPQAQSQQGRYPQQYAQRPAAYAAPAGYARPTQARRGDEMKPIRVFHDHSRLGDANYFEPPCGALLAVEGGNLTFTPTGGEAPLVIPATEILEIRMNTAVAKEAGAFHVITKQGLYLHLAPESATADEGRADVDQLRKQLRKQLGLDQ